MQHLLEHRVHSEYKVAVNKFKKLMQETRGQNWMDWLEGTSQQDLYIANKYILNKPTDYSSVWSLCYEPQPTTSPAVCRTT